MKNPTFALVPLLCLACAAHEQQPAAAPAAAGAPAASGAPAAVGYAGHGVDSLSPEVLATYPVLPLDAEVSRRIEAMMDVRSPSGGFVSDDGKSLYFSWSVTGTSQVWKLGGPMRFPTQLTGGGDDTWVSALLAGGRWLVLVRDRKGEEYPGLYLQEPSGGPLLKIQHVPKVQTRFQLATRDGKTLYFTANDIKPNAYAVYRYDVDQRTKELVFDDDGLWSVSDLSHDERRLLLRKATGSRWGEYFELDLQTRTLTHLFGRDEKKEHVAAYGAGGEILVQTNKLGEFRRLYVFEDGALAPVTPEIKHDVAYFTVDRNRRRILYGVNEAGFFRLYGMDARTKKPLELPKLPEADHVFAGPTSANSRYSVLAVSDSTFPTRAFVLDWKTGTLTPWHEPSFPEIDTSGFARATLETYQARDGTAIPALVRMPPQCAGSLCPVIVRFHGGPESQARPGFNWRAQLFVDAGFIFVEPNVRGSNGFGKTWLEADDGPKRLAIITDIEDAARWARTRFAKDGQQPKLGVYGGSYGGYSVLVAMTMFAGAYDAGVNVVGISNLVTFLENTAPYRRKLRISEYGDPVADREALEKLSPTSYIDRLRAPLLSMQGANDPRVPAGEAVQIHVALEAKGIDAPLMIFPDEGHGARKRSNRVLMFGHAVAFLEKHLK